MTIILMIPTLVASVYGMNVALPFNPRLCFWITVSISIGMASLVALILFRKNLFDRHERRASNYPLLKTIGQIIAGTSGLTVEKLLVSAFSLK